MSGGQMQAGAKVLTIEELLGAIASPVDVAWDYCDITDVASGNGVGQPETVVFKTGGSGGVTVGTLTMTYNSNHNIASVTFV